MPSTSTEQPPAAMGPPAKAKQPKWTLDVAVKIVCPYCREDPPNLIDEYSSGDTICGSCGLVMAEHVIDERAEWRTFSTGDDSSKADPNRVGTAQSVFESGTGFDTTIADKQGDRYAQLMNRTHKKISSSTESRFLTRAYGEIEIYCGKNGIQDDVRDVAKHIYKSVDEGMKLNNRSAVHEAVVASCILIACRQCKVDRTFREIFLLTNVPKKDIGRTFKRIEHFLLSSTAPATSDKDGDEVTRAHVNQYISTTHTEAGQIMTRFCNMLGYDIKFTIAAEELVNKISKDSIFSARSPLSIAGGAIYTIAKVLKIKVEQATVARCLGVSVQTINSMFKRINAHKHEYFDPEYLKKIGGSLDCFPYLNPEAALSKKDTPVAPPAPDNPYILTSHANTAKNIIRFCNLLGYDMTFIGLAEGLVKKMIMDSKFSARNSNSIAGGAIYAITMVLDMNVEVGIIAHCVGVSSATITSVFKGINVRKHEYFDAAYLKKIGGSLNGFPYLDGEAFRFPGS